MGEQAREKREAHLGVNVKVRMKPLDLEGLFSIVLLAGNSSKSQ
jgi:hypothetical protein